MAERGQPEVEAIPQTVRDVLLLITSHRAVRRLLAGPCRQADGSVRVEVEFEVSLPSRAKARGYSATGVRVVEPVILDFPPLFPYRAPVVKLRKDFNRGLPHINPGSPEGYVRPCLYDGDPSALLHESGWIDNILNQAAEWLNRAAADRLIDPGQGWEPVRRDEVNGSLAYDADALRERIGDSAGSLFLFCRYFLASPDQGLQGWITDHQGSSGISARVLHKHCMELRSYEDQLLGDTLAVLAWSDEEHIVCKYLPETVTTVESLDEQAERYGCKESLRYKLNRAFEQALDCPQRFGSVIPIFVILCARRPYPLTRESSALELLAYCVLCARSAGRVEAQTPVYPLAHHQTCSPALLQRLSGIRSPAASAGRIVMLGCGSLGSKIALHLARAGCGPWRFVDHDIFHPHNIARHALFRDDEHFHKAAALASRVKTFGLQAEMEIRDIIDLLERHKSKSVFPENTQLIVDATASVPVLNALAAVPVNRVSGRLMQVALYGSGQVGVIAIEGRERNPRIDDLRVRLFDLSLDDQDLAQRLYEADGGLRRQPIGQGCGSYTMVVSDARISLYAAGMAERARQLLEEGFSQEGELSVGCLSGDGLGVVWRGQASKETVVLHPGSAGGWEVRLLAKVSDAIECEARAAGSSETGGVLIGYVCRANHCLIITRTLPAPPDSQRSPRRFVLGTQGLVKTVRALQTATHNVLTYVGTWHSHPRGEPPSQTDRETLARMKALRLGEPTVALIWAPQGFQLLFDRGASANSLRVEANESGSFN